MRRKKFIFKITWPDETTTVVRARGFTAACMMVTGYRVRRAINLGLIESISLAND